MRKKRGTSKTCVEKSSIPSVDVHIANNNLVFCCYICICFWNFTRLITVLKNFFFNFFTSMGGGGGGGGGGLPRYGGGALHSATMYLLFGAAYWSLGRRGYFGVSNVALVWIVIIALPVKLLFSWMPQNPIDGKSELVQAMAWCIRQQAISGTNVDPNLWHHIQLTKPQWVKVCRQYTFWKQVWILAAFIIIWVCISLWN